MLTIRATPKISEKPMARSAYALPLTRPVTRMSWNIRRSALARESELLHSLHLRRPEGDLLPVLPLHGDARVLAEAPDRIVGLVELEDGARTHVLRLLEDGHELVGVGGAGLLDGDPEQVDRVVGAGVVGGRLVEALLERLDEGNHLRRHLHLGVGVERGDVVALAGGGLPEPVL